MRTAERVGCRLRAQRAPAPNYGRLRAQRAPVRSLCTRCIRVGGTVAGQRGRTQSFSSLGGAPAGHRRFPEHSANRLVDNPRLGGWARPATEVAPDTAKSAFADSPRGFTGMACFSFSVVAHRVVDTALKKPHRHLVAGAYDCAPRGHPMAEYGRLRSGRDGPFSSSVMAHRAVDTEVGGARLAAVLASLPRRLLRQSGEGVMTEREPISVSSTRGLPFERNLDLAFDFALQLVADPSLLADIPEDSTVVLLP